MIGPDLDSTALSLFDDARAAGAPIGVAVSGGSDSTALLLLLQARFGATALRVATVDHGLRAEAAGEAAGVAALCTARGIAHDTLAWRGWDGTGNLQDAARHARYRLLAEWANGHGIPVVALGHTSDDNAETFVMGLARGAGLDGLSGMRPGFARDGVRFLRPLLAVRRAALRTYLSEHGVAWTDEPSNSDPRFERVRVRAALAEFEALGVTPDRLSRTVANLRDTRSAIARHLADWSADHVTVDRGDLLIAPDAFARLPQDFARRLFIAGLRWISGTDHPPRGESVLQALDSVRTGTRVTLHGCTIARDAAGLRIAREPDAAARAAPASAGTLWDNRWRVTGPGPGEIGALTEAGLTDCPDWRDAGLPRASLAASPAVRAAGRLIAAPLAGLGHPAWRAELAQGRADFPAFLISR